MQVVIDFFSEQSFEIELKTIQLENKDFGEFFYACAFFSVLLAIANTTVVLVIFL